MEISSLVTAFASNVTARGEIVMKKHLPYDCEDDRELFDDSFHAASMSECTGLIPSAPMDQSEVHSYSQIYDIPLPNFRSDRRDSMNNQNNNQNNNQRNNQNNNQKNNQNNNQKNNQNSNQRNQSSNEQNRSFNN